MKSLQNMYENAKREEAEILSQLAPLKEEEKQLLSKLAPIEAELSALREKIVAIERPHLIEVLKVIRALAPGMKRSLAAEGGAVGVTSGA